MKKGLLALFAVAFFWAQLPCFAESRLSGAKDISYTSGQDSSNATVTVVAAPGANNHYKVYKLAYHIDGADTITFSCGATAASKAIYTYAGEAGLVLTPFPFYIECDTNTAITITKGTAGTLLEHAVWYQKEWD